MPSCGERPFGVVAGWCMISFVSGVGAHSSIPFWHPEFWFWIVSFPLFTILIVATRHRAVRVVFVVLLSFLIGFWRFDVEKKPPTRSFGGKIFITTVQAKNGEHVPILERWRSLVTQHISDVLPSDAAHLVAGILYGDAQLTKEEHDQFVSAGLMHIVAVSGSNVTIVIQVFSMLAVGMHLSRRRAFWVLSASLLLFVGFVGFSASVARAAIMGWLVLVGRDVGRLVTPMRLLLVASVILLLIQPWQLFFDAGFALSFFAMWGILSWSPFFEARMSWLPKKFEVRQMCSMTLAATFMTAPYLAWCFGRVTLAGLVTNLFALPLIPFVMGSGVLVAIWGSWPGSDVLSAPALGLARIIFLIAGWTRFVPWLEFRVGDMKLSTLIATYALLMYLERQQSTKMSLSTARR